MTLDAALLITFVSAFSRCTAMVMASPIFGTNVPVKIRLQFCLVLSLAMVPVLREHTTVVPQDMAALVMLIGKDVTVGLLIGGMVQIMLAGFQMAGAFLDVQIGIGAAQVFSPALGTTSSPLSQFKFLLGLVLLLLLDGHHFMFRAFAHSYEMAGPSLANIDVMRTTIIGFFGQVSLMALQIAAPVAAVCIVVDAAAGLVNKAVPQTQPFLLALPAKLMIGLFVLGLGLPAMVVATRAGVGFTFEHLSKMLGGP